MTWVVPLRLAHLLLVRAGIARVLAQLVLEDGQLLVGRLSQPRERDFLGPRVDRFVTCGGSRGRTRAAKLSKRTTTGVSAGPRDFGRRRIIFLTADV